MCLRIQGPRVLKDLVDVTSRSEEFNEQQWNLGSQATMAQALDLRILANQNLDVLAPDARDLMINMQISTAEVLQMMPLSPTEHCFFEVYRA